VLSIVQFLCFVFSILHNGCRNQQEYTVISVFWNKPIFMLSTVLFQAMLISSMSSRMEEHGFPDDTVIRIVSSCLVA
jgi:hypothetical protein